MEVQFHNCISQYKNETKMPYKIKKMLKQYYFKLYNYIIVFHIFISHLYISYSNVNEISYFKEIANCI